MEKYGFVYLWYDIKHKRFYVGCRWGHEDDGYVCSSVWMKQAYKHRPNDFKRRILKTNIMDREQLLHEEHKILSMIKEEELGKKYYNLTNRHFGHWATQKEKRLTVAQKIKESHLNDPNWASWNRGPNYYKNKEKKKRPNKLSPEHIAKLKAAAKGRQPSELNKINRVKAITGVPRSEETKQKIRNTLLAKRELIQKISNR